MNHIISRRQVQAGATSLEADKEQITLTRLECSHSRRALFD